MWDKNTTIRLLPDTAHRYSLRPVKPKIVFSLKSFAGNKKAAPFSREQYDYILADLLKRKETARLGMKRAENDERAQRKANDRDQAFNRLIDSIWKEQYSYYKRY